MRACFFAHYDRDGIIDDYVVHYIKELKKVCNHIIFASVSNVSKEEQKKLDGLVKTFINRDNEGYDFGSWRDGIKSIGFENLSQYTEIVLANDSCYGPIYDIEKMFSTMYQAKDLDAWSIIISYQGTKHMQSYFLVLRQKVFQQQFFVDFFKSVGNRSYKIEYIQQFELGFSKLIIKNQCKIGSYCKIRVYDLIISSLIFKVKSVFLQNFSCDSKKHFASLGKENVKQSMIKKISSILYKILHPYVFNASLDRIKMMIKKYRMPLVKVMLFRDNPYKENLKKAEQCIKQNTNYDFSLIKNHQKRMRK
jgi:rhamnosyltransferase